MSDADTVIRRRRNIPPYRSLMKNPLSTKLTLISNYNGILHQLGDVKDVTSVNAATEARHIYR